jgi:hypothetical protein
MKCPRCKTDLPGDIQVCGVCGQSLRTEKARKKLQAIGWIGLALIVLFLFALAFSNIYSFTKSRDEQVTILLNEGERTTGTIVSKKVLGDSEDGESTNITYTFTTSSGQRLTGKYTYHYSNPNVGDQIEIAYDRQDPATNLPTENDGSSLWLMWLFGIAIFLPVGYLTFWLGGKARRTWKLCR